MRREALKGISSQSLHKYIADFSAQERRPEALRPVHFADRIDGRDTKPVKSSQAAHSIEGEIVQVPAIPLALLHLRYGYPGIVR